MSRTILLADDSLTIQKVVELTFQDTDYSVIAVSSGDKLLEQLPQCNPDIVICDVIMPGRDGYDICQEIKSNSDSLHLPVILLTGTFEPFDRDRALAVGCSEIITKPFEARKLVEAVERLATAPPADFESAGAAVDDEPFEEGRVTPPPPLMPPEELLDEEAAPDFEDTEVPRAPSPPVPEAQGDALDFTNSGFLEMEKAGLQKQEQRGEPPTEGLEFELDAGEQAAADLAVQASADPPLADAEVFADFEQPVDELASAASGPQFNDGGEVFSAAPPFSEGPPVDDLFPAAEEVPEEAATPDHDQSMTTPINVAEVMGVVDGPATEPTATEKPVSEANLSDADTQDLGERVSAIEEPAEGTAVGEPVGLSDDDIDRIARRVVEIAGERIEHIAWEVIPDTAEIVVRERLKEIEAEAENS